MYSYPPLFPLSSDVIQRIVLIVVGVALAAGISTQVLRLPRGGLLWLLAFSVSMTLAAIPAVWDVSPALTFWTRLERWVGGTAILAIFWLLTILPTAATQGHVSVVEGLASAATLLGLVWLMTPTTSYPKDIAQTNACSYHLWGVGIAIHGDAEVHEGLLMETIVRSHEKPPRSWRVELLPFLEQPQLRKRYENDQTWDAPANEAVARTPEHPYVCPNNLIRTDERNRSYTAFLACTGSSAFFPTPTAGAGRARRFDDIRDGISNTAMLVEACGQNVVWTEPRDLDVDTVPLGVNLPGVRRGESAGLLSSHDPSGAAILLGDGATKRLSADTDLKVLKAMLTIDGGESVRFD